MPEAPGPRTVVKVTRRAYCLDVWLDDGAMLRVGHRFFSGASGIGRAIIMQHNESRLVPQEAK